MKYRSVCAILLCAALLLSAAACGSSDTPDNTDTTADTAAEQETTPVETERETLLALLSAEGKLNEKCLTGMTPDTTGRYALDLADLVLFENLRTVILNDRLIMADKTALTESWCAVIEH